MAGSSSTTIKPIRNTPASESDAFRILIKDGSKFDIVPVPRPLDNSTFQDALLPSGDWWRDRFELGKPIETRKPTRDPSLSDWEEGLRRTSNESFRNLLRFNDVVRFIKESPKYVYMGLGLMVVGLGLNSIPALRKPFERGLNLVTEKRAIEDNLALPVELQTRR